MLGKKYKEKSTYFSSKFQVLNLNRIKIDALNLYILLSIVLLNGIKYLFIYVYSYRIPKFKVSLIH